MTYFSKTVSFEKDLKQEKDGGGGGDDEAVKAKLQWEELYMAVALTASLRSKDPKTRVGCCIVDSETYTIVSTAYNGFPPGLEDTHDKWEKEAKKDYVIHAEANALVLSRANLRGAVCYVTLFPCKECAKLLTQAGIKEVTYLAYPSDSGSLPDYEVSREIFKAGEVKLTPFAENEQSRSYFLDKLKTQIDVTMQGLKRKEKPEDTVPMSEWPGSDPEKDYQFEGSKASRVKPSPFKRNDPEAAKSTTTKTAMRRSKKRILESESADEDDVKELFEGEDS